MCAGQREDGTVIEPNDPFWADLHQAANAAKTRPLAWLEQSGIYADTAADPAFSAAFVRWITLIWQDGTEAALAAYIGGKR